MGELSPLEVDVLIHYWGSRVDHPNISAPAVRDAINKFYGLGLLVSNLTWKEGRYSANREALEPYIHALCSVPLPILKWVLP